MEEAVASSSITRSAIRDIGRHTALVDEHLREEQRGVNLELQVLEWGVERSIKKTRRFQSSSLHEIPRSKLQDVW
jgi:hypothetical protein